MKAYIYECVGCTAFMNIQDKEFKRKKKFCNKIEPDLLKLAIKK